MSLLFDPVVFDVAIFDEGQAQGIADQPDVTIPGRFRRVVASGKYKGLTLAGRYRRIDQPGSWRAT